jgi:hypothetical protein
MKKVSFLFVLTFCLGKISDAQPGLELVTPGLPADAKFEVVTVSRDSFPLISVLFRTYSLLKPQFTVGADRIMVTDDSKKCKIISVKKIEQKTSLNVGLVLDHSGSMEAGGKDNVYMRQHVDSVFRQMGLDKDTTGTYKELYNIVNKLLPPEKSRNFLLESCKPSFINFVTSLNLEKDSVSVVAFGDATDVVLPLSNNFIQANSVINSLKAKGGSAILEGIMGGINQLKYAGEKRALIVLTDGVETSSPVKIEKLIQKAKEEKIPIYIIGVGEASTAKLTQIAVGTGGEYYYATSSLGLDNTLAAIGAKIKEKSGYLVRAKCPDSSKSVPASKTIVSPIPPVNTDPVATKTRDTPPPVGRAKADAKGTNENRPEPGDPALE